MLQSTKILGTRITTESEENILEYITSAVLKGREKVFVATPNPEILVYAQAHPDYQSKLNSSQVALPDGVGLLIAARLLRKPLNARITGVDFIEKLCELTREKPMSMGFFGRRKWRGRQGCKVLEEEVPLDPGQFCWRRVGGQRE